MLNGWKIDIEPSLYWCSSLCLCHTISTCVKSGCDIWADSDTVVLLNIFIDPLRKVWLLWLLLLICLSFRTKHFCFVFVFVFVLFTRWPVTNTDSAIVSYCYLFIYFVVSFKIPHEGVVGSVLFFNLEGNSKYRLCGRLQLLKTKVSNDVFDWHEKWWACVGPGLIVQCLSGRYLPLEAKRSPLY